MLKTEIEMSTEQAVDTVGHADQVGKVKYARKLAMEVAAEICRALKPFCSRLIVAGSLRRRKLKVGDVEILYIGTLVERPDPRDWFKTIHVNQAEAEIAQLEITGVLERRQNVNGREAYGPKNKLMRHKRTGVPVDLFAATELNWFNYLVCRTGPAESNMAIAAKAQELGWRWNPYGPGFSRGAESRQMDSEQEVFKFVGLPYKEPWERI